MSKFQINILIIIWLIISSKELNQIIAKNDELYSSQKPYQSDSKRLIFLVNVENQNIKEDKDRNIKIQYALFKGVERDLAMA